MINKKYVFFILFIPISFLQYCSAEDDVLRALKHLQNREGIKAHYFFIKAFEKKRLSKKMKRYMEFSRELADIELTSILIKPEKFKSKKIHLDDAEIMHLRYIIGNDAFLNKKYNKFLIELSDGKIIIE